MATALVGPSPFGTPSMDPDSYPPAMTMTPDAPESRHQQLNPLAAGLMLVCCILWGLQQVVVKVTLAEISPLVQATIRSFGAALLVWAWAVWRGVPLWQKDGTLWAGVLAGALFAAEFGCIYLALPYASASRLVVFLYLAPFVVAGVLPRLIPAERLDLLQTGGLMCAFAALAYAFQEGFALPTRNQLLGDSLAIAAAVLWGATTLVVRVSRLARAAPEKTLFYQLAVSALLLAAGSWGTDQSWPRQLSLLGWESLVFQTLVVAFASYLTWFWLLRHFSATRISAFSFLTPMFGLIFGTALLHERLGPRIVVALAFVALGIYLVNRRPMPRRR